jgi:hypothetical protein
MPNIKCDLARKHIFFLSDGNGYVVIYIKINRLGWAGHVIHMDSNRIVKKVFNTKPTGIRKIGRPKLRWEDDVIQNIKNSGVKNWRNLAMEKES